MGGEFPTLCATIPAPARRRHPPALLRREAGRAQPSVRDDIILKILLNSLRLISLEMLSIPFVKFLFRLPAPHSRRRMGLAGISRRMGCFKFARRRTGALPLSRPRSIMRSNQPECRGRQCGGVKLLFASGFCWDKTWEECRLIAIAVTCGTHRP